jgi:protein gp37
MAEISGISWTDATFNPWIGCTKVSVGEFGACEHCYAERDNDTRFHWVTWGPGQPRKRTSEANWKKPLTWNRQHHEFYSIHRHHRRVFCASLADVFDNEVDQAWRDDLWTLIDATPNLRWILLTKRIGNATNMIPDMWQERAYWPEHVGLMSTIVTQDEWDRDYKKLAEWQGIASWIGISAEPLFGRIDIGDAKPDWIITGGESGPEHRPLDMDAVRSMRDQCARNGVAFHHKQNGGIRGKDAGCLIDGEEHKFFPHALVA